MIHPQDFRPGPSRGSFALALIGATAVSAFAWAAIYALGCLLWAVLG